MKLFQFFLISLLLTNCSFDKKSGIWNDENSVIKKNNEIFKDFKKISEDKKIFDKIIQVNQDFRFFINKPIKNNSWLDIYFSSGNNLENLQYNDNKNIIFKGKKISKNVPNKNFLFKDDKIIVADDKGSINVFSFNNNEIVFKYNFYK